jgi:hypothetical protein
MQHRQRGGSYEHSHQAQSKSCRSPNVGERAQAPPEVDRLRQIAGPVQFPIRSIGTPTRAGHNVVEGRPFPSSMARVATQYSRMLRPWTVVIADGRLLRSDWEVSMPTPRVPEHHPHEPALRPPDCPRCTTLMRFVCIVPHQRFSNLDEWRFACDCGETFIDVVARSDERVPDRRWPLTNWPPAGSSRL